MLAQRLRRWPVIETALGDSAALLGPTADELREGWYSVTINVIIPHPMPIQYWSDVADAGPTLNRIGSAEHL